MFRSLLLLGLLTGCTVEWVDNTTSSIQEIGEGNQDGDEARPRRLPRMLGTQEGEPFRGTQEGEPATDDGAFADAESSDTGVVDPAASPPDNVSDTGDTGDTDEPEGD